LKERASLSVSSLAQSLNSRGARAVLALLALRSPILREYLRNRFEQPPGTDGSFLSDPVIEAAFGYETTAEVMRDLAGTLLAESLIKALDNPGKRFEEQRFPKDRHPYLHQVSAWRCAKDPAKRGYVVSSGTGSGKTECFLIPILDDLVRESEAAKPRQLIGTRALFLYPLNALINSQRERLSAWTRSFGGNVRFCLYNGETPEEVPAHQQQSSPQQILSRRLMRDEPAPILVTNATMLEYMLVRQDDAPILQQSSGTLRWIVIDEAHTYVGSQAAELSMLMRRVMDAFGVKSSEVKFVATSATLGGEGAARKGALARFIADIAGCDTDQVEVLFGRRFVPPLDEYASRDEDFQIPITPGIDPRDLFEKLASSGWFRRLRLFLAADARTLGGLLSYMNASSSRTLKPREMLEFLDAASLAMKDDELLLPLRVHVFHRTQSGIWACINPECKSRRGTALDVPEWPFGGLLLARRETCPDCEGVVLELVRCNECGSAFLSCSEESRGLDRFIVAGSGTQSDRDDEFDLVDIEEDESETEEDDQRRAATETRLIATESADDVARYRVDPRSGEVFDHDLPNGTPVSVIFKDETGRFVCPLCGGGESMLGDQFRSARVGAPFLLNVAIPTLLEHTPPLDTSRPMDGRRIITFSDSRQGTARFAVRSQLDSDRNHARSVVYHQLLAAQRGATADLGMLEDEIRALSAAPKSATIDRMIEERKRELEAAKNPTMRAVPWSTIAEEIQHDTAIRSWAGDMWDEVSYGDVRRAEIGDFYLLREFARRPRRESTLETMGLVALTYPDIDRIGEHQVPAVWRERGATAAEWREFLTALMDHFIRSRSLVEMTGQFINWVGAPVRTQYVLPPGQEAQYRTQVRWPVSTSRRSTLPRLLATGLKLDLDDNDDRMVIDLLLEQAWNAVSPMLKLLPAGYVLNMKERIALKPARTAFKCPITGRLLANTFRAISPYALFAPAGVSRTALPVALPTAPHAWWHEPSGRKWTPKQIEDWLETTEQITALRREGVWSDRHDRVVAGAPFFRVVEHSAQQDGSRLLDYEQRFRHGDINVMSCSTTMEMGVDIGGVSAVAMNNAPPGPANFLQRAGRAGRRNESTMASLTLCKSDPHGEAVFRNPLWPFKTPIFVPRVSLESDTIVQRHVNAFLLGSYFRSLHADVPRLTTGWFFNEAKSPSPAEQFIAWVKSRIEALAPSLERLLTGTHLSSSKSVVEKTAKALSSVSDDWARELRALNEQIAFFTVSESRETPAQIAAGRQRERLVEEYLLRELTVRGFLPAYGFPSNVVPFVQTTLKQIQKERRKRLEDGGRGREDSTARWRGYPSREIHVGIRDYAPGNQTVIDGRVYESAGVTLNWHIPPGDTAVRETQVFSQAWLCRRCGATGASSIRPTECPACQHSEDLISQTYLQPAGFAVDIGYQPHNRLDTSIYVPVEEPWITAGSTKWLPFENRLPLRIRSNTLGHVFHYSRGLYRDGFAVCLRCGRAESVNARAVVRPLRDHFRLRGGKEFSGRSRCEGNDQQWAIKSGIWLGSSTTTDVFEMQFTEGLAVEESAAYSLAIAMRDALAAKLGIEQREIGPAAVPARGDGNQRTHSVVLFDRAALGAGYATEAPNHLSSLLSECAGRLQCTCDRACQRCLLTYETQFNIAKLDRMAALRILGF